MTVEARAHPNIALIKYWGKQDVERNTPAVGSVSITLDTLEVLTRVAAAERDSLSINGHDDPQATARAIRCLRRLRTLAGISEQPLRIESQVNFPVAAGLASSAAGFAALVQAADSYYQLGLDTLTLARLAGFGSGSAARSLFGGFVRLDKPTDSIGDITVSSLAAPLDWPLNVVIAVTETGPKPLSSGDAMRHSAETSDFYPAWVANQEADIDDAAEAIRTRDFARLARVAEASCMRMHAVMLAARPATLYWNATTVALIYRLRELQADGVDVFFTIDAGPQIKAVCLPQSCADVSDALATVPGVRDILVTGLGPAAHTIS